MDISQQGRIISLKSGIGGPVSLANGGVYWVNPRAMRSASFSLAGLAGKISLEEDIFPAALAFGQRLLGIEFSGAFIDIGVPHDYHRASTLLAQ